MKEVNKADFLCLYFIPLIWYILAVSTCHLTIKLAMITTFKSAALPSNFFETSSLSVSRVLHSLRACLPSPEKREQIKPVRSPVNIEALNFILSVSCKGLKESRREPTDMSNIPSVDRQDAAATPPLLNEYPDDEEESFSTQQLFKFAWQIAKGMVGIIPLD